MITIEQIKAALDTGNLPLSGDIIETGKLTAIDGSQVNFEIWHGWDIVKCRSCDREWGPFNLELLKFIKDQNYDESTLETVLNTIQVDDRHWEWFEKGGFYQEDKFHWFFLMAEGKQQAACLIYHPKPSAETAKDIYYIEYIAVAPWNRENPMHPKTFSGVGSYLIKAILSFAIGPLGFSHGFSLHALPRASGFYAKIGMQRYPELDKETLQYFEMSEKVSTAYAVSA